MKRALLAAFSLILAFQTGCKKTDPELAAKIRKEVGDYIASRPALKPEENGAIRVLGAAKALKPLPPEAEKDDFDPATENSSRILEAYLKDNAKAVDDLVKALSASKFQYTTDLGKGAQAEIPRIGELMKTAKLLVLRGRANRAAGHLGAALDDHFACLDLGVSLSSEPFVVSHMLAVGAESRALHGFLDWLTAAPPDRLVLDAMINGLSERWKRRGNLSMAFDGEYYIFQLHTLAQAAAGEVPVRSDFKKDYGLFSKWHSLYAASNPARYFEVPDDVKSGKVEEDLEKEQRGSAQVAACILPSLGKTVRVCAEHIALWRCAMLAAAILRARAASGSLPVNLEAATAGIDKEWRIDPFTGKDIVYRLEGGGFILYSAGPDGKDDGGKFDRWTSKSDVIKVKDMVFFKS